MALISDELREVHCRVVYFGASLSGKTTNLTYIHQQAPTVARGNVLTIPADAEAATSFDFLPIDVGTVDGYRVRLQLYAVPGQTVGSHSHATLIKHADGVVFVADSQRERFVECLQSHLEMTRILEACHQGIDSIPLVIQYNKRDLPDAIPVPILNARLNPANAPSFEAIATTGVGVFPTLQAISQALLERL